MELYGHSCQCCQLRECGTKAPSLEGIIKTKPQITFNTNRFHPNGAKAPDGIEIRFGATRPTVEVRDMLKAHGFKFSEKQTMWYARDSVKSRELASYLESNEVDADDTQYEKKYLWAKVASMDFFDKLTNYTEFMLGGETKQFFKTKGKLLSAVGNPASQIYSGKLRFKKFYNKAVGEDGEEGGDPESEPENESDEEEDEDSPKPVPQPGNAALADKLQAMALSMQKTIDAKINSATSKQRPTPKRLRVAAGMRAEGYAMRNVQTFLYGLASAHRSGAIDDYHLLNQIKSRAQVELINRYNDAFGRPHDDKYLQSTFEYNRERFNGIGISSLSKWKDAIRQRDALINNQPSEFRPAIDIQAEKVRELEMKIKGMRIPGFFPTPISLIEELIGYAGISVGDEVLEPSAGKGDILDKVKEFFGTNANLYAAEINPTLREMLTLKGYSLIGTDFLEVARKFDCILMNPPFENKQDIDHVTHALSLLKPGGRLAAIMSEGTFSRSQQKDVAFRELLADRNAHVSAPIKGAFKDAFNQTGITVRLVAINEDGSYPEIAESEQSEESSEYPSETDEEMDETDKLELEALAEMELIKLKIELENKKRRNLNGLDGIDKQKMNYLKRLADKIDLPDLWDFK